MQSIAKFEKEFEFGNALARMLTSWRAELQAWDYFIFYKESSSIQHLPSRLALPGLVHPQIVTPVLWRQQIVVPVKCQVWSCWQQRGKNRHALVQPLQLVPPPRFNPRNHRGKTTTWSLRAFSKELRLITLKLPDQAKSCIMLACMIILNHIGWLSFKKISNILSINSVYAIGSTTVHQHQTHHVSPKWKC